MWCIVEVKIINFGSVRGDSVCKTEIRCTGRAFDPKLSPKPVSRNQMSFSPFTQTKTKKNLRPTIPTRYENGILDNYSNDTIPLFFIYYLISSYIIHCYVRLFLYNRMSTMNSGILKPISIEIRVDRSDKIRKAVWGSVRRPFQT